jgi:hypothetical protein
MRNAEDRAGDVRPRPSFLPLFTQVPRRGILGSSLRRGTIHRIVESGFTRKSSHQGSLRPETIAKKQKIQNTTCPDAPRNSKLSPLNSIGPARNLNNMTTHIAIKAAIGSPTTAAKCPAIFERASYPAAMNGTPERLRQSNPTRSSLQEQPS